MKMVLRKFAISVFLFFQEHIPKTKVRLERDALIRERNILLKERQDLQGQIDKLLERIPITFSDMISSTENAFSEVEPVFTIVGSAGRTATQWLTDALNCHDDVFFTHGANVQPTKEVPTDREALFVRMALEDSKFDFRNVDGFFDVIQNTGNYGVYGCVHALNAAGIVEHQEKFRRRFVLLAICRHPIRRINSFLARSMYEVTKFEFRRQVFIDDYKLNHSDMLDAISEKYNVPDLGDEDIIFIQMVHVIFDEDKNNIKYQVPIYTMERLTMDLDYFLKFFLSATNYSVSIDEKFVRRLREVAVVDNRFNHLPLVSDDFLNWPMWRQAYFRDQLEQYDLYKAYQQLGYDLSVLYKPELFES